MQATRFEVGQRVVASVNAQGMKQGARYTVTAITAWATPFGTFVSYMIEGEGRTLRVENGHLLLVEAGTREAGATRRAAR